MLRLSYDSLEDIDEAYRSLYSEKGDKLVLTGVAGMKTQDDIDNLQEALRKEREDHKDTKTRLKAFNNLDPEEVFEQLDKIEEYKIAADGKMNDEELNKIVESRLRTKMAPLERELNAIREEKETLEDEVSQFKEKDRTSKIHESVTKAYTSSGANSEYLDDVLLHADRVFELDESGKVIVKDGVGFTPGIEADVWITEMQPKRAGWWPENKGAGGKGPKTVSGIANNPWMADSFNLTEQGRIIREHGKEKAQQLAALAGKSLA